MNSFDECLFAFFNANSEFLDQENKGDDYIDSFLSQNKVDKNLCHRLICWLIEFGIISPEKEKALEKLKFIFNNYKILINKKSDGFHEIKNLSAGKRRKNFPYSHSCHNFCVSENVNKEEGFERSQSFENLKDEQNVLIGDIQRTVIWFNKIFNQLKGINDGKDDENDINAEKRVNRIFNAIFKTGSSFSYAQGYDRFAFANLALTTCALCNEENDFNFPLLFAEAITYELTLKFMLMSRIKKLMNNMNYCQEHFNDLDSMFSVFDPQKMKMLKDSGNSSIHFVLRWEFLLFCEEHDDIRNTFLIWDNLIRYYSSLCNSDDEKSITPFQKYLNALSVAHFVQVKPVKDQPILETLQQYRDWVITNIISTASKVYFFNQKSSSSTYSFNNALRIGNRRNLCVSASTNDLSGHIQDDNKFQKRTRRNSNQHHEGLKRVSIATFVAVSSFCSFLMYHQRK